MRYIIIVLLATVACATEVTEVKQPICTQEDIDNGTCGDPGGGSSPSPSPVQVIEDYESSVIAAYASQGYTVVSSEQISCYWQGTGRDQTYTCHGRLSFGGFFVAVTCWLFADGQPRQSCESRVEYF